MTFSVAALCPRTGEIGYALATSSMAAGARAAFLSPRYGVVFAQGRSDPHLGALGLAMLEIGRTAEQTLAEMLAATPHAAYRQLAVLDAAGRIAHATGSYCLPPCGAMRGTTPASRSATRSPASAVIPAMLPRLQRLRPAAWPIDLIAALEAGVAAGGEPYPLRSAAVKVARPELPVRRRGPAGGPRGAPCRRAAPSVAGLRAAASKATLRRAMDPANAPLAASDRGPSPDTGRSASRKDRPDAPTARPTPSRRRPCRPRRNPCRRASRRTAARLRIAVSPTYPPLESRDPATNALVGFDIDLGNALAKQLGVKAAWQDGHLRPADPRRCRRGGRT